MENDYFLGISEEGFHRIVYSVWGDPHPIPTLCVHGLTRNRRDFDFLAKYLSEHQHQIYCPDIVGRGDSDWMKNPLHYTYEQYIADMNVMIGRMAVKQINWIGTSMGGLIGMMMASLKQSPIKRLVLNDIGPQIPVAGIARLSQYAIQDPEFSSVEEAKRYFKMNYTTLGNLTDAQWQHFTETSIREISPGKFQTKVDHAVKMAPSKSKIAWQLLLNPHKALEGTFFDVDLWEIWRKITCPVLVIHGKKSDMLLSSAIQKMQEIHPQTELIEIEDAGHAPALMDAMTHEKINQWLNKGI